MPLLDVGLAWTWPGHARGGWGEEEAKSWSSMRCAQGKLDFNVHSWLQCQLLQSLCQQRIPKKYSVLNTMLVRSPYASLVLILLFTSSSGLSPSSSAYYRSNFPLSTFGSATQDSTVSGRLLHPSFVECGSLLTPNVVAGTINWGESSPSVESYPSGAFFDVAERYSTSPMVALGE